MAPTEPGYRSEDVDRAGWALLEISGGVLALEQTGYGDPTRHALVELSAGGRAAAVVRNNIQAHLRFGCAQDGQLLFDDDEFMYIEDPSAVPADLRPLFDLVWDDLEQDIDDSGDRPSAFVVGLAMAELITGVPLTGDQINAVMESGHFAAPSIVYPVR